MSCCIPRRPKTPKSLPKEEFQEIPDYKNVRHQVILQIPGCKVHLMDEGEVVELGSGIFELTRLSDENVSLATTIKVGHDLQWPLTKDEPVVKLGASHYLFSLPLSDAKPLSYGVTFSEKNNLDSLDSFLKENSLFTISPSSSSSSSSRRKDDINWKDFAPAINAYNNVLAKAIAGGTGQIVKGIFKCSNAYTNQVHKGAESILTRAAEEKNRVKQPDEKTSKNDANKKKSTVNKSLKRVRELSQMTEKMSKSMLDIVGVASTSVMGPMVRSQAGKAFISMVPGEVLVASLDAINRIIDAAEAAEKQTMTATSGAVTRIVAQRYGDNAGEATGDALATAGHVAGTAWNVFKIRKAINPASSMSSGIIKSAAKSVIKK